ncbi:hypothetical protein LTR56_011730 [Elasticomyces elasticus]|nr:hypothetical protein LTR56_011730 [Elasticomyces elasticus]KAK3663264.1 hypothetical protein LTR22_005922 [Elasticomyces elasticus]KAK5766458.1 hypothetical protein LTS12_003375 [Elasticomyces elasticus]
MSATLPARKRRPKRSDSVECCFEEDEEDDDRFMVELPLAIDSASGNRQDDDTSKALHDLTVSPGPSRPDEHNPKSGAPADLPVSNHECASTCRFYRKVYLEVSTNPPPKAALGRQAAIASRLYTPIKEWQTRLLVLQPSKYSSELQARLNTCNITEAHGLVWKKSEQSVPYTALSYTWGPPDFCCVIRINGETYPITETLYCALRRLRRQQNRKAFQVDVWLGEWSENTNMLFKCLPYHDTRPQTASTMRYCPTHAYRILCGMQDILERPWFSRVWVKQEIWAAQVVVVKCGGSASPWTKLKDDLPLLAKDLRDAIPASFPHLVPILSHRYEKAFDGLQMASKAAIAQTLAGDAPLAEDQYHGAVSPLDSDYQGSLACDIVSVMARSTGCECSDPRDHIYGLLGMTGTDIKGSNGRRERTATWPLAIDYDRHPADIFEDLMWYLIRRDGHLGPLLFNATYGTEVSGRKLPSWVVDWRCGLPAYSSYRSSHNAAWGKARRQDLFRRQPAQYMSLPVLGFCIGHAMEDLGQAQAFCFLADWQPCQMYEAIQDQDLPKRLPCLPSVTAILNHEFGPPKFKLVHARTRLSQKRAVLELNCGSELLSDDSCLVDTFSQVFVAELETQPPDGLTLTTVLVPVSTEPNDLLVCVKGCQPPLVLRHCGQSYYKFIGQAMVAVSDGPFEIHVDESENPETFKLV